MEGISQLTSVSYFSCIKSALLLKAGRTANVRMISNTLDLEAGGLGATCTTWQSDLSLSQSQRERNELPPSPPNLEVGGGGGEHKG